MAKRRTDPYLEQAQLESGLQIDPQIQALSALLAGKRTDYIQTRRVNASNARGIGEAANTAALQTAKTYGGDVANPAAGSLLAALKGSANTPEGQAAYNRVAGEMAQSVAGFQGQAAQAEAGRQYGNQEARHEYMAAKDQINGSYQDLLAQGGKLTAATYGKLLEARRQRATTKRGQDLSAATTQRGQDISAATSGANLGLSKARLSETQRHDRAMENKKAAGDRRLPGGAKLASQEQHMAAQKYISSAVAHAKSLHDAGLSRDEIGQTLLTGVPNEKKNGKTIPGVPAIPQPFVTTALDQVFNEGGHLSRPTQTQLQRDGFSIRKLGLKSYGDWKKALRNQPKPQAGPLNPAGGILNALGG